MDLRRVAHIVRKHWIVASIGFVLACGLGVATYLASPKTKYSSTATLFVTEPGFPFASPASGAVYPNQLGNFTNLAYLYAQIAQSDQIRRAINAPLNSITANVVTSGAFSTGTPLPFLDISAQGKSPSDSQRLAEAATAALRTYIISGEAASHAPRSARVTLQQINAPAPGQAVHQRTRVVLLPAVVFLTVLLLTLALIFILENARQPEAAAVGDGLKGGDSVSRRAWTRGTAEDDETLEQAEMPRGATWRRR
jgi:hypothetical protein